MRKNDNYVTINRGNEGALDMLKRLKKKDYIAISVYVATLIFAILFIVFGSKFQGLKNDYYISQFELVEANMYEARVKKIISTEITDSDDGGQQFVVYMDCEILEGEYEGKVHRTVMVYSEISSSYVLIPRVGALIYVSPYHFTEYEATMNFTGAQNSFNRVPGLIILVVIFAVLVILFARRQGFNTILSLIVSCLAIFLVFIPAILSGHNIYLWTFIISGYSIVVSLLLIVGANKKGLAAILGSFFGVLVSGLLAYILNKALYITGKYDEDTTRIYELFYNHGGINLPALIFAATTIGSLGAVLDITLSLASSLKEVYDQSSEHSIRKTIKSGFVIGKDMVGTMTTTLILAYVGSSLSMVLYMFSHYPDSALLKQEILAVAVLQAIVGSMALLFTIPITSIVCALLYNKKEKKEELVSNEM